MGALDCMSSGKMQLADSTEVFAITMSSNSTLNEPVSVYVYFMLLTYLFPRIFTEYYGCLSRIFPLRSLYFPGKSPWVNQAVYYICVQSYIQNNKDVLTEQIV